jgi:hypothetical protein
VNNVSVMTSQIAREIVDRINAHAQEIGRLLLLLKESEGWRPLGYGSWTAFLENEFVFSRKHLYEIMRATPVIERLVTKGYGEIPLSHANTLAKYPEEIQVLTYEIASKRQGGATIDRLNAIGETLTEARANGGYVTTQDGTQVALENAINSLRTEQEIARKESRKLAEFTALLDGWTNERGSIIELETSDVVDIAAWVDAVDEPVFKIVIYALPRE